MIGFIYLRELAFFYAIFGGLLFGAIIGYGINLITAIIKIKPPKKVNDTSYVSGNHENSCLPISLSIISGISYNTAKEYCRLSYNQKDNGAKLFKVIIDLNNYSESGIDLFGKKITSVKCGYKLYDFFKFNGEYLIFTEGHALVVKNGELFDSTQTPYDVDVPYAYKFS